MKNLIFLFPVILIGQSFTQLDVRPRQNGDQGVFRLFEKRVNGANFVSIIAPDSVTANATWKWPAADAVGCFSSDGAGNIAISACSGAGSFVDLTTAQSISGLKTFNSGVEIRLGSTARYWGPETDATYDLGGVGARWANIWGGNFNSRSGIIEVTNAGGFSRAAMSAAGISTFDGVGVALNTLNTSGINTNVAYLVNFVQVIDNFRNVTANSVSGSNGSFSGNLSASGTLSVSSTSAYGGLATFNSGVAVRLGSTARYWGPEADATYDLGGSTFRWANIWGGNFNSKAGIFEVTNAGGVSRAAMSTAAIAYYDGAGIALNVLNTSGINTTVGYNANGTPGVSRTCSATDTIRQPTFIFGILTGGTCAF